MKDLEGVVNECPFRPFRFQQVVAGVILAFGLGFGTGWFFRDFDSTKKPAEEQVEDYHLDKPAEEVLNNNWATAIYACPKLYDQELLFKSVSSDSEVSAKELKAGFAELYDRDSFVHKMLQDYKGPAVVPVASQTDKLKFQALYDRNSRWRPLIDEALDADFDRKHSDNEINMAVYQAFYQR